MANPLKDFTDKELKDELARREKKRRGPIIGYRAISYGDEYTYGHSSDYMIENYPKGQAMLKAEERIDRSENGGYVQELYKDTLATVRTHEDD